ncbi:MAG: hypothetical protein ABW110_18290, partial [Steroidobacteraceae bacterium]
MVVFLLVTFLTAPKTAIGIEVESEIVLVEFNFSRWSLGTLFHFRSKVQGHPVEERQIVNPYHAVSVR